MCCSFLTPPPMLRFLCCDIKLVQRRKLPNGNFLEYPSLVRSLSSCPTDFNHFTVSYLVNSCGLSQEKAISVSKKLQLKASVKPDSVLTLFRNHGFPNTHISKIIQSHPSLLLSKVDKTLEPKLEYFKSIGLSGPDLAKVIALDPGILKHDLENQIIPAVAFLRTILDTDDQVIEMLKRSVSILRPNVNNNLVPNIELLLAHGVPKANISWLLIYERSSLTRSVNHFVEVVEEVKEMGFDPLDGKFVKAVDAWSFISTSSKEERLNAYKQWGWSDDDILAAFKKHPSFLKLTRNNITRKMEFFVSKMGYDPLVIAKCPRILCCSLEKTIIPRCLVMEHLIANGLLEKDYSILTILVIPQEVFLERFVTKFNISVPGLLDAFRGKMGAVDYICT